MPPGGAPPPPVNAQQLIEAIATATSQKIASIGPKLFEVQRVGPDGKPRVQHISMQQALVELSDHLAVTNAIHIQEVKLKEEEIRLKKEELKIRQEEVSVMTNLIEEMGHNRKLIGKQIKRMSGSED